METVTTVDELRGQWMLAHISYPSAQGLCFAYPQYVIDRAGTVRRVAPQALPNAGAFGIMFPQRRPGSAGAANPEWFRHEYGTVAAVYLSARESVDNAQYDPDDPMGCRYFGTLTAPYGATEAQVQVEKASACVRTRDLLQVVELDEACDLSRAPKAPVTLARGERAVAGRAVIEQVDGSSIVYYGPVELQPVSENSARLSACDDVNGYVTRIDSERAPEVLTVRDVYSGGAPVARFIDGRPFSSGRSQGSREDWVGDAELVEKVAQGLRAAKRLRGFSQGELKDALASCRDQVVRSRWERVQRLVEVPEYWGKLGDVLHDAMMRPDMEKRVVQLALSDEYLPQTRARVLNTEAMQREAAKAEADANREFKAVKADLEKTLRAVDAARADLAGLEASYEEERERALADTKAELDALEGQVASRRAELAEVEADLKDAGERQRAARAALDGLLDDRVGLAASILRDSVVRSAVEQAVRSDRPAEPVAARGVAVAVAADEDAVPDRRIAEGVREALSERAGRDLPLDEVVNLLVCLVQGPVTVLSGLPGTGKTSLVRALAGSLGLTGAAQAGGTQAGARYVEVGVERGWTSHRDWVGYYNPVTACYEKSDPEVFDALTALAAEPADGSRPPFLFLLDEMNLSPAEYYWAPFLRACDTYNAQGCRLDLGGERRLAVPPCARFMATVNFDHTTEALSPRLLDRAWVLRLEPVDLDLDETPAPCVPEFSGVPAYSWGRLVRAFGATGQTRLGTAVKEAFRTICSLMAAHGAPVSQRSQAMVRGYVEASMRFADRGDTEAGLLALDRAVAQKVLPQVNVPATPDAQELVDGLAKECASLPLCQRIVERMREAGADDGFYTYFA